MGVRTGMPVFILTLASPVKPQFAAIDGCLLRHFFAQYEENSPLLCAVMEKLEEPY
jgi:hypothetical protein